MLLLLPSFCGRIGNSTCGGGVLWLIAVCWWGFYPSLCSPVWFYRLRSNWCSCFLLVFHLDISKLVIRISVKNFAILQFHYMLQVMVMERPSDLASGLISDTHYGRSSNNLQQVGASCGQIELSILVGCLLS